MFNNIIYIKKKSNPLLTGLVSYWKLDGSPWLDSHGGNNLTDNNTVGSAPGVSGGNAANFVASNSEYLDVATTRDLELRTGDTMTVSVWLNPARDDGTLMTPVSKFASTSGEWTLFVQNGEAFLRIYRSGFADTLPVICPKNAWTFLVLEFAESAGKVVSTIYNVGAGTSETVGPRLYPTNHTANFTLGSLPIGPPHFYYGRMAKVGFWKRLLIPAERTELYGAGTPPAYPF